MTTPPTPRDELLGTVLDGRYRIDAPIGRGGMGVVYRARQLSVDRDVAVKVVSSPARLDEVAVARLVREGRLAGAVSHPGVVTLIDQGRTPDGLPYLVMELVAGRSLKDALRGGPLPVATALAVARQLADALAAVHALGVVHRDLKPGNVMVLDGPGEPRVKVLDFGLAKSAAGEPDDLTRSDVIVGTPLYMAPEVLFGDPPDARADLYALGGVLYEMLAGRPPHVAATPQALMALVASARPAPLPPAVPAVVSHVVERLTARRPEDRCASAAQARELLDAAAERCRHAAPDPLGETQASPVATPSPSPPSSAPRPVARRTRVRVVAAALAALAVAGGALALVVARPAGPPGAFDGRYRGLFWPDAPPCSEGRIELTVEHDAIEGTATGAVAVDVRGAVLPSGDSRGEFREGRAAVGRFEGRFQGGRARGTLRDDARNCTGTWEVLRAE